MAFYPSNGSTAAADSSVFPSGGFEGAVDGMAGLQLDDDAAAGLSIFDVSPVRLEFSVAADFVAAQVANNVLVLALSNGRILRIDLDRPQDIDDVDLPRKPSEAGVVRRMFLDPTASHLIICTSQGENYYLHAQSRQPRPLSRLRGVVIESIAWNPALPTASTREILVGASDGNIYETFIETSNEFYKKEEKYLKNVHKLPDGGPVTGLWAEALPGRGPAADQKVVMIASHSRLYHLVGKAGRTGQHHHDGSAYTRLFDSEEPTVHELTRPTSSSSARSAPLAAPSSLVVSPDPQDSQDSGRPLQGAAPERVFAWLSSQGVFHGPLLTGPAGPGLGAKVFAEAKLLPRSQLAATADSSGRRRAAGGSEPVEMVALTQWHVLCLVGQRIVAANRLTGDIVLDQKILEPGQRAANLCVDLQKNTFWLFTAQEIFEIVVRDEDRDIWRIMLRSQQFDAAMRYARTPAQRDAVATASGDYLVGKGLFAEAAGVYGRSNKPFEEVALTLIDAGEADALRKYLLVKLASYKKSAVMQRIMIATWLIEVFMAKLNSLDDTIVTKAELGATDASPAETRERLDTVRGEYQDFVTKYKSDLDRKTVYAIVSSHGREEELLFFANAVNDYNYVLSYWVQREKWAEALGVLKRQTEAEVFYRYSSVLMAHVATDLVEILMRQSTLNPRSLIPALLEYDRNYKGPAAQNQAIRYLQYVVNQLNSTDAAVHNTLVSMYAASGSGSSGPRDEVALLSYLEAQGDEPRYDPDFALRLCIQHRRVLSCVHIYTSLGQYLQAVDLALSHDELELAAVVADRPMSNPALRKRLWLAVARRVISRSDGGGIRSAIDFLRRCDLLRIEDLIPFFPDFVVIDDFREEICAALEDYGRSIDSLKREMEESSQTAANIRVDIAALDRRYAIVEPGEKCYSCGLPLLSRQFFVFPCQHAFHSDCLGRRVMEQAGVARSRRIKELQVQISKGLVAGAKKEEMIAELDALVAASCILCSDYAIKMIDEPFVREDENKAEWAL
ncbi:hypothetical protein RB600_000253 [Gaeumannomyces tritici]